MLISQEGYYFGVILDGGFGQSPGEFPQETLMLQAQQVYDPDGEAYVSVDPVAGTDITWYGILIDGKDKETLNSKQLKKVTGWDGASLVELSEMDMAGMPIQFRVEARTYNEETKLKVTWIDPEGAFPFRSVPKLGKEETLALQARYASVLAANKKQVAAVSAPGVSEKPKRTRRTKKQIEAANSKPDKQAEDPVIPAPATRPTMPKSQVVGKCTADEAWVAVELSKRDDVTGGQLADTWRQTILQHAPGGDEDNATDETWFLVRRDVLAKTGKV